MFAKRCRERITLQKQSGLYRNPPRIDQRVGRHIHLGSQAVLNFASNDYLGLGNSEQLRQHVARNFKKYGSSASSSRLVSGNYDLINEAEKAYANYFGYEEALFFPSGFQANLGLLTALFEPGDTVFFDKHIHASMVKGLTLSQATYHGFNHNSMTHLEKRLAKVDATATAVVTESLFSMDGDLIDSTAFSRLKSQYQFLSIIDEAHAFGAIGDHGRGVAQELADLAVGTFGKALGLFGAFILMPAIYKEYMYNFSSPLIYTTTLPEAHAASALDVLEIIAQGDAKRSKLQTISAFMKSQLKKAGFPVKGDAHILALQIGNEAQTAILAKSLLKKDIFVLAARFPTVPLNQAILRIGLTADHTETDINTLIKALKDEYAKLAPR